MLTPEEVNFLTQFIMSRPLNGLNLFDAKKALDIIAKLNSSSKEE